MSVVDEENGVFGEGKEALEHPGCARQADDAHEADERANDWW